MTINFPLEDLDSSFHDTPVGMASEDYDNIATWEKRYYDYAE
jgi:hypothetical protein